MERTTTFFSSFVKPVDAKGRVSIPAPFRHVLDRSGPAQQIMATPSTVLPMIECGGNEVMDSLLRKLASVRQNSDAFFRVQFMFSQTRPIPLDGEGRIALPAALMQKLGITKSITFAGAGTVFQIWEPSAFEAHELEMSKQPPDDDLTFDPISIEDYR